MLANDELTSRNILHRIKTIYERNYKTDDTGIVEEVLADVIDLFNGKRRGFQKCDIKYHNLFHTLQTVQPFIEIIDGWNRSGITPEISKEYFDSGIISVLLHDTGYIKGEGDMEGTGAKYTFIHIQRSIDFANTYLSDKGFDAQSVLRIANAIRCTGIAPVFENISFNSEEERIIGHALGAADLLGQMSAPDYLEKLPLLFAEFEEAYRHEGIDNVLRMGIRAFGSAHDLLINTAQFYKNVAMERLVTMGSMHTYIPLHYETSGNPYIEAIEKNIGKIEAEKERHEHSTPRQSAS